MSRRTHRPKAAGDAEHLEWLALVEVSGPFLTLPVLRRAWPNLEAIDKPTREALNVAHAEGGTSWIDWVLNGLLEWGDRLRTSGLDDYSYAEPQHDVTLTPSFILDDPDGDSPRLLGLTVPAGTHPHARIKGDPWPATPVDRLALLCRHHGVPLGLVTDGRWWTLVWARRGAVTTSCVFDSVTWPEASDRVVVRAFRSLLHRARFFAVPDGAEGTADERLPALLEDSGKDQEEVTDALGIQVRRAVEMLVEAIGRADVRARATGAQDLAELPAAEVYQAAVTTMMRVVFLLFAEERGLLPADNPIYAAGYSASDLADELKQRADQGTESELEHSHAAWRRLMALCAAVHGGIDHPRLHLPAYDGSLFDPQRFAWLTDVRVDDRTVLHMLTSVQFVVVRKELRRLSFRALDVEQIGYVYEGLLSFDGYRAAETMVGLIGRDGSEEEVNLTELERIGPDPAALAERFKDSGIGSVKALERKLAPLDAASRTAAQHKLLAVTDGDRELAERLVPFAGVIREDLRGLPVVILPGALYVTASSLRADTGTHYTPRELAERVVEGALEPLVFQPGPLQTADRTRWKLRSAEEILRLKVADIAMGSGAFLVGACRYLAGKLIEAWAERGDEHAAALRESAEATPADAEADPMTIDARRQVIQHCLYGVDINSMAVEMAKLSLWLVSMDKRRPFTFLDDRLACGDSLLGIGNSTVLRGAPDLRLERDLAEVVRLRRELSGLSDETIDALEHKRKLLDEAEHTISRAKLYADLIVAGQLASAKANAEQARRNTERVATLARAMAGGETEAAQKQALLWLATDLPEGLPVRQSLHWPLTFPEVFEAGGFDAIVGNPPFLGGKKISGALGGGYREFLIQIIGKGVKGHADLVAYLVLRAHQLLAGDGQTGLIATDTLAQGDTREVGLDQLVADGVTIRQAIKSEPWPSRSAQLQYCAAWTSQARPDVEAESALDGEVVPAITSSLDPQSRVGGTPKRLLENSSRSFIGSYVLGLGFIMEPEQARHLIAMDSRNAEVLFPYLNGQDLNNRPDCAASRWVINFFDRPLHEAQSYTDVFQIVERDVMPGRQRVGPDGKYVLRRPLPERYWQYADKRPKLYATIAGLKEVIVLTLVSNTITPALVPTGQVFAHKLCVFATDDPAMLAFLSSSPHYWWAIKYSSTRGVGAGNNYSPSDVFETLARPELTSELRERGQRLDGYRRNLMLKRNAGLTATYNLVHSPKCVDEDIAELRRIHVAIDEAVLRAYGWADLELDHGFHETRQGVRYTVGAAVRQEILDRLLELNHQRYAAEQAAGATGNKRRKAANGPGDQASLF